MTDCNELISIDDQKNAKIDAENFGEFVNSMNNTFQPRIGDPKRTIEGVINYAEGVVSSLGYVIVGDFADAPKVELTNPNQLYTSKSVVNAEDAIWRYTGALPYTPTEGAPTTDWVSVAQGELKSAALAAGTTYDNITYSTNLVDEIKGYIFDATKQITYAVPEAAQGKFIDSVVDGVLTTTDTSEYSLEVMYKLDSHDSIFKFSSISKAISLSESGFKVVPRSGDLCSISSYSDGWSAVSAKPSGGGDFIFVSGSSLSDGVVNFATDNGSGSWMRIDANNINIDMAGARTDNVESENDASMNKLLSYCSTNNTGFNMQGMYKISETIDTSGVTFISGCNRDFDGFHMPQSAGKTIVKWERPTTLKRIRILGSISDKSLNDGSIGLDGAKFLNRAESIGIFGCGVGHRVHDAVSCHMKHFTISGCNRGALLDGFDSNAEFSTTVSYSDSTFQGNYDGVVGGSVGGFSSNVIGLNFHNCVWESNTHAGIVASTELLNGVQYASKTLRNVTFTGFAWFEGNGEYAFVLDAAIDVSFLCRIRNEGSQPVVYPSSDRVATYEPQHARFGNQDDRFTLYKRDGVFGTYSGYAQSNFDLLSYSTYGDQSDESILTGFFKIQQNLDYASVGRLTKLSWGTKEEGESEATEKMQLSRQGNLTIAGSYSPFTGVHLFHSKFYISTGLSVKGVSFNELFVDEFKMEGECDLTNEVDSTSCLGVVDSCVELSNGYLVSIAAAGDSSTKNMKGVVVDGDFEVGDYLSTSGKEGRLKRYNGASMKPVVMQVKGVREGGIAYGYFH